MERPRLASRHSGKSNELSSRVRPAFNASLVERTSRRTSSATSRQDFPVVHRLPRPVDTKQESVTGDQTVNRLTPETIRPYVVIEIGKRLRRNPSLRKDLGWDGVE